MKRIILVSLLTISIVAFLIGYIEISNGETVENKNALPIQFHHFLMI